MTVGAYGFILGRTLGQPGGATGQTAALRATLAALAAMQAPGGAVHLPAALSLQLDPGAQADAGQRHLAKLAWLNLLPNGKAAAFYGISALYARDKRPFKEDLPKLCKLLEAGRIRPIIAARFPILEAAQANALLESGGVAGNVVLLAPELLKGDQGNRRSQKQR